MLRLYVFNITIDEARFVEARVADKLHDLSVPPLARPYRRAREESSSPRLSALGPGADSQSIS